ncbi:hypothetical protein IMSAG025_02028 [Muribaculaceae bacterium]|nr:hypothetical protein IMSAG025_02028 [Muribaculaceae bacterium]
MSFNVTGAMSSPLPVRRYSIFPVKCVASKGAIVVFTLKLTCCEGEKLLPASLGLTVVLSNPEINFTSPVYDIDPSVTLGSVFVKSMPVAVRLSVAFLSGQSRSLIVSIPETGSYEYSGAKDVSCNPLRISSSRRSNLRSM